MQLNQVEDIHRVHGEWSLVGFCGQKSIPQLEKHILLTAASSNYHSLIPNAQSGCSVICRDG